MTDESRQKFAQWIADRDVRPECIACGASNWQIGEVISGAVHTPGTLTIGGPTIPMVQLVCGHCAAVLLFAAGPIGLAE